MLVSGFLLAVWGVALLALAKPLHVQWGKMNRQMRLDGVTDTLPLTRWLASEGGLRTVRIVGGVSLAAGAILVAAGALAFLDGRAQP